MYNEYRLSYTASEINEKLDKIDSLESTIAVPGDVKLAIYEILSAVATTEHDLSEQLAVVYAWADNSNEPSEGQFEFDLICGNVTFNTTYIKYWHNNNGSINNRMVMNPFCAVYDPTYQYTFKLNSGEYFMAVYCLSGSISNGNFLVDGTKDVEISGTDLAKVYNQKFSGGGECVIPACDYFYVLVGRNNEAVLTEEDIAWLCQNFTVETVRI